jgi:nucleoside phosphorylase
MSGHRVLIVSALVVEAKAILSYFDDIKIRSTPGGVTYTTGRRKLLCENVSQKSRDNWSFIIAAPTDAGNVEVSRRVAQMIPECEPELVALIGCAGGFPGKIEQYDVAVASYVHYVARNKIGSSAEIRPLQETCSKIFVDHCKNVQLLDAWHQYLVPETSNAPINVYFEPIVSGETVLANSSSEFLSSALKTSPRAVAIEMEGYGLLGACRDMQVEAVVVRGISDTLDNKLLSEINGCQNILGLDRAQYKATRHAAALFFATLDFINPSAFAKRRPSRKKDITKVSMILDAEMHNVSEIQSELFEIFKKYGIKNFSFKQANSIRVDFDAQADAMRILEALINAGIVKDVAGHDVIDFSIQSGAAPNKRLSELINRIKTLSPCSIDELLQAVRAGNWIENCPEYTKILLDALKNFKQLEKSSSQRKPGRILYPHSPEKVEPPDLQRHFGPSPAVKRFTLRAGGLRAKLDAWEPQKATNELLRWFTGDHLLDHEIPLDTLLSVSKRKLFYSWPSMSALISATSMSIPAFLDACSSEWEEMRGISSPSICKILDQERWDRLGRRQIRDALEGRPATLSKAIDLLALTSRVLMQNELPPKGCIIPSIYSLTFNGTIASDGVIERMLLTGMAGDLKSIADENGIPLRILQGAIRGQLFPYHGAMSIAGALQKTILIGTRLSCSISLADPGAVLKYNREAADLTAGSLAGRYVVPRN